MYSYEIQQLLELHNYTISNNIYLQICTSSQINHVKYTAFGDFFEIWTDDNYYWKFTVYREDGN